jgi:osmoprotectant transport system ATP-binding protein
VSDSVTTPRTDSAVTGARILLENVSKRYPGQAKAAVDGLTLEIPAGSIVMLVGPSGCGKTTTLKMINRLIEPTEGRIVIDGQDVTSMNGDELRRGIGYVIQAGGLFPHMSVATNIGMVPKMLGWDKQRIAARVDELLELVSLDPAVYRDRYPRELSGGQQQRVGVARALAADPPVLLMDEPFGAVDPITRQRLQDELINIQHELQKTIVCVTHDFDEAVKLGDWIAVFDEGARIVQYDAPERVLAEPADEFVEDFIGSGAGLKQLTLTRVREVDLVPAVTTAPARTSGRCSGGSTRRAPGTSSSSTTAAGRCPGPPAGSSSASGPSPGSATTACPWSARAPRSTTRWTRCSSPARGPRSWWGRGTGSRASSTSRPSWPRSPRPAGPWPRRTRPSATTRARCPR